MIIYKVTNLLNNKIYIGKTKYSLEFRKKKHQNCKQETYFHRAIRKYRVNNFKWEIIDRAKTEKELSNKEKNYIKLYKSNKSKFGYNLTDGGEGLVNPSRKTRNKIKFSKLGIKNPNYKNGLTSLNLKRFCSKCNKPIINPYSNLCKSCCKKGLKYTNKHRKNLSLAKLGDKNPAKQDWVKEKIRLNTIKYIYHAKCLEKEYYGIWDLTNFCKKHKICCAYVRGKFGKTDKVKLDNWIFTREKKEIFSYSFFSNYLCKFYPCHNVNQNNCLFCYCPLFFNCNERNYEGKKCEECYYPHMRSNYNKIIRKLKDNLS